MLRYCLYLCPAALGWGALLPASPDETVAFNLFSVATHYCGWSGRVNRPARVIIIIMLTVVQSEEYKLLLKASQCSRDILAHVNHAVKDCENHHKLLTLQKRLDTRPIQNSTNPLVADYKVSCYVTCCWALGEHAYESVFPVFKFMWESICKWPSYTNDREFSCYCHRTSTYHTGVNASNVLYLSVVSLKDILCSSNHTILLL